MLSKGFKIMRQIMEYPVMARLRVAGNDTQAPTTDRQIAELIRDRADTIYHPVGTCKMGPARDPLAVVDSQLRVHGIERLRVVDASIMPDCPRANTNVTTMMIAERLAASIRGED